MKTGAAGTDEYLAEWRKVPTETDLTGTDMEIAQAQAELLDQEYDQDRIKALIAGDGWA